MTKMLAISVTLLAFSVFSSSCSKEQHPQMGYSIFQNATLFHVELIDSKTLLVDGDFINPLQRRGTYKVPLSSIENPATYTFIANIYQDPVVGSSGPTEVKGYYGDDYLLLSGYTPSQGMIQGSVVGRYDIKSHKLTLLTPDNDYYFELGFTRNKSAVLLSHKKLIRTTHGSYVRSDIPTLIELDLASGAQKTVFESPEFHYSREASDLICPPFQNASGSSSGKYIVILGRRNGGGCAPYLITNPQSVDQQIAPILVLDTAGTTIWYPNEQNFLMVCGNSIGCKYNAQGSLVKMYEFPYKGFYLADYDPKTDTVLLVHHHGRANC